MNSKSTWTRRVDSLLPTATHTKMLFATAATIALLIPTVPTRNANNTVILSLTDSMSAVITRVAELGGRVVAQWPVADSMLVELPYGSPAPEGSVIVPDAPLKVAGARASEATSTLPQSTYLQTLGATSSDAGRGIQVALVDTGVADSASALLPNVTHLVGDGVDGFGHGTFLAGLIGGHGQYPGVAPEATILDVKVAENDGTTSMSRVLDGLQAVYDDGTADVLNISLAVDSPIPPQFDPLTIALNRLWDAGVVVVAAAGNDGPDEGSVGAPGNDATVITVGSVHEAGTADRADDTVAGFSARSTREGDDKPDLVAPGVSLISTRSLGSLADGHPAAFVSDQYMRGSGTSMSAAVASGAVAALLSQTPDLSPNAVKKLLMDTAYSSNDLRRSDGAGAGGLDLAAALQKAPSVPAEARQPKPDDVSGHGWGPAESDETAWAAFAAAWEADNWEQVLQLWDTLSFQTQQWASRAFALAVVYNAIGLPEAEFSNRASQARSWALDAWLTAQWQQSGTTQSYDEWLSRSWGSRSWGSRSWGSRSWGSSEWLTLAWSSRSWGTADWASRSWGSRSWGSRSWGSAEWAGLVWESRSWGSRSWGSRSWGAASWDLTAS